MIFIYGISEMIAKEDKLSLECCPNCNKFSDLRVKIAQKYAQFFWIPLFPIWKSGAVTCDGCKTEVTVHHLTPMAQAEYKEIRTNARTPRRTFIGIVILATFICTTLYFGSHAFIKEKMNVKAYINNPQAGDVYTYNTKEGNYRLLKAIAIESDSIVFQMSKREVSDFWEISDLREQPYADDTLVMGKNKLKSLFDKKTISDVRRLDSIWK